MKSTSVSGFTLVEMLVSISIFTIITSVAVFNYNQFNSSVLLTNLAYDIALSVRQAQFYGISVKQTSDQKFDAGYGVHFDLTDSNTSYTLFEDRGTKHVYESGTDIDLQVFNIKKGNFISKICITYAAGSPCFSEGDDGVDISFIRPNPDTYIVVDETPNNPAFRAEICVSSPQGTIRKVIVDRTGQISVDTTDLANCTN